MSIAMTTSELSKGNYVMCGIPMFVVGTYGDDTLYLDFDGNEGMIWEEGIDEIEPIRLESNILLNNGFKLFKTHDLTSNYRLETDTHIIHVEITEFVPFVNVRIFKKDEYQPFQNAVQVEYIHEFQNAIKLITKKDLKIKL